MKKLTVLLIFSLLFVYMAGTHLTKAHHKTIGAIPADLEHSKEVSFLSKSGANISGWLLESKQEKGGILLLHGVRSSRLQMLNRAKFLQKAGYTVLLIDFQAHGESSGEQITFGHLESLDAESAYEYLERTISNSNIGVIGISLGGASALLGKVKLKAKAMVLESVYPTIEEAINDRLTIYLGSLGRYFSPLLTLQLKPRMEIGIDDLRPIDHIAKVKGALLVISGSEDQHTTKEETQRLFSMAKEPKELWIVEGAKHINFDTFTPIKYREKILDFFNHQM